MGVIETLTEGFATLNKRLWLLLIPVVLDLFLAFGPGITADPLVESTVAWFQSAASAGDVQADQKLFAADGTVTTALRETNIVTLAAWQLSSLVAATAMGDINNRANTIPVYSYGQLVLLVVGMLTVGLLLTSFYLGGIAGAVQQEALSVTFFREVFVGWLRFLLLVALVVGILFPLGLTLGLMAQLIGFIAEGAGVLIGSICLSLSLAAFFYISFADDAIFVAKVNPVRAIWYSFEVVRLNFWSTVGMVVLIHVILNGLRIPLNWVIVQPFGLIGGVGAYAYVATGLSVGSMLFFRQRLLRWQAEASNPQLTSV